MCVPDAKMSPSFMLPVSAAAVGSRDRVRELLKMSSGVDAEWEDETLPFVVFILGGRVLWGRGRVWKRIEGVCVLSV